METRNAVKKLKDSSIILEEPNRVAVLEKLDAICELIGFVPDFPYINSFISYARCCCNRDDNRDKRDHYDLFISENPLILERAETLKEKFGVLPVSQAEAIIRRDINDAKLALFSGQKRILGEPI